MEINEEDWSIIFSDVEKIASQYFGENINRIYKKKLAIEFKVARYEGLKKAYTEILNETSYRINISRGMLVHLMDIASTYVEDKKFIMLINPLKSRKLEIRNFLFFTYIDLIILHEWAHIFCGHLEYLGKNQYDVLTGCYNDVLRRNMELEADSKAATLFLARLAPNHIKLNNIIYGDIDGVALNKVWDITVYSILSLFDYYEDNKLHTNTTHPKPSYRAFTNIIFIAGEIADKPNIRKELPFISNNKNEIYEYFAKLFINFYTKYKGFDTEFIIEEQTKIFDYCSKVGKVIKESGLNKHRLIPGQWC